MGVTLSPVAPLLVALLLTGTGLFTSNAAAQVNPRLTMFVNVGGQILHRTSIDFGRTWNVVHTPLSGEVGFQGSPAVVTDRPAHAILAGLRFGQLGYHEYNVGVWSQFRPLLASFGPTISGRRYTWASEPALSSWGTGRYDLFIRAFRDDGAIALLHTWANNGQWAGIWESLGTGLMQARPPRRRAAPAAWTCSSTARTAGRTPASGPTMRRPGYSWWRATA
jgi:hypothetical protein